MQFRRVANLYFLMIAVLSTTPVRYNTSALVLVHLSLFILQMPWGGLVGRPQTVCNWCTEKESVVQVLYRAFGRWTHSELELVCDQGRPCCASESYIFDSTIYQSRGPEAWSPDWMLCSIYSDLEFRWSVFWGLNILLEICDELWARIMGLTCTLCRFWVELNIMFSMITVLWRQSPTWVLLFWYLPYHS